MPELPEVETIRRGLVTHVLGRSVEQVVIHSARAARRLANPTTLDERFAGRTVREVARRGKFLWLVFEGTSDALVVHLGMSGQLLFHTAATALPRHAGVSLQLDQGLLLFVDQRTFGYLDVSALVSAPDGSPGGVGTQHAALPALATHIARDPLDPCLDLDGVTARMHRTSSAIKRVLLDQRVISGIGNIYADETLWHAAVHPATPARDLAIDELSRVIRTSAEVMAAAIRVGGTSFDSLYVDTMGQAGYFSRELQAYGRTGQPCGRCGTPLIRTVLGGRSTHLCPRCQFRQPRPDG